MISVLIVDDDKARAGRILELVAACPGADRRKVHVCHDLISTRDKLSRHTFDVLILDLVLPNRFGEDPLEGAGRGLLTELEFSRTLMKPASIIGLSAFDIAVQDADAAFDRYLWKLVKYDASTDSWSEQIKNKINYLINSRKTLRDLDGAGHEFDLAVVAALHSPELESILRLDANWKEERPHGDAALYYVGEFGDGKSVVKVVAASAHQMGMPAATALSMKIINRYRPRFIGACGILAGFREAGIEVGDVLLADQSWDYGSGKLAGKDGGEKFLPDPKFLNLEPELKERAAALVRDRKFLDGIRAKWKENFPREAINAYLGPVASGAAVIATDGIYQRLQAQSRKVLGLEMETYGVFYAAANCTNPRPRPFSIKGVSDHADAKKTDDFRSFAAFASAEYLRQFAISVMGRPVA